MTETAPLLFRPAAPADADRIAALLTDEGYPTGPSDIIARLERFDGSSSTVVVADAEGEIVGFIALHVLPRFEHDDVVVRILALVVDPGARDRGIGQRLVGEAERVAAEVGAAFVETTAGHHRPEARGLFEARGYDATATTYLRRRI